MMKKYFNKCVLLLIMALIFAPVQTSATVITPLISYQGRLLDSDSIPMDSTVSMTFKIYDASTGGSLLWSETKNVQISAGLFNTQLGDVTPLAVSDFNRALWLEIVVGAETLTPRQQLMGAPYAFTLAPGAVISNQTHDHNSQYARSGQVCNVGDYISGINADGSITCGTPSSGMESRMTAIENLLKNVSRSGDNIYVDRANVHIRDGSGSTDGAVNGLGNLIIGYNEVRGSGDNRTGSHNLVLGSRNNYRSYGGLAAGYLNEISGAYASVSGGESNTASGSSSSVSGGQSNIASNDSSSVSGGTSNTASGEISSVSGGYDNTASGLISSVSGGNTNTANGLTSSVSGGNWNIANNSYSSVSGGYGNTASGSVSSVSGGYSNTASGSYSSVSGGYGNTASGSVSSVSGGFTNKASGLISSVSGGLSNTANGQYSSVSGGQSNIASNDSSSVSGGTSNTANGLTSSVSGGILNKASGSRSSVSGGYNNTASGSYSSVSGGYSRSATSAYDWAAGGLWENQ